MSATHQNDQAAARKYRIRPAIVIVTIQWILWLFLPLLFNGDIITMLSVFGGMAGGVAVVIWWLFFSRIPWGCRVVGLLLMVLSVFALTRLADPSITTAYQGMMIFAYAIPTLSLGVVAWASFTQRLPGLSRRLIMIAAILISSGFWLLFRSEGIGGSGNVILAWRWSPSVEERFLSRETKARKNSMAFVVDAEGDRQWPGFRGPGRNAVVKGIKIQTDWDRHQPEEVWRSLVGPGCSSFAVKGDFIFTQEQREDNEAATCYSLQTGEPVWIYAYEARFWDSHAGAGPRSTPTVDTAFVFALGATGLLHALDISDGRLIWSRDAASDARAALPGWGFSGSPLVVDDMVLVAVSGTLTCYSKKSGELRWIGPEGGEGYSSPQLAMIDGVQQVLMAGEKGVIGFDPATGTVLWSYENSGARIVQSGITVEGKILVSTRNGTALCCLDVQQGTDGWSVTEEWTSNRLKPNFNDFVIHQGYAYGYDGMSLSCVNLKDGSRMWKSGNYGGQLLLLEDQGLLLVISEKGSLTLIEAEPVQFSELGMIPVLEGKTWNHPAMAGNILLVRNSREMAAYRL